ncbi:hypothetical protein BpHYR1_047375 [Brachionus plicatilis]|uniref:Uncharacterized protein n=1 Tax=Brachionus plicatilis TaxID=10195 RepID=A0A3M7QPR2_BRAPC|nr:hypothetical protein BpHYR1_047375 [Brachionus plicatilis]
MDKNINDFYKILLINLYIILIYHTVFELKIKSLKPNKRKRVCAEEVKNLDNSMKRNKIGENQNLEDNIRVSVVKKINN